MYVTKELSTYTVTTFPIPTDQLASTTTSTRLVDVPEYFAESGGYFFELDETQLRNCMKDNQVFQCPFDIPKPHHQQTCLSTIYYRHNRGDAPLRFCRFEFNPVYEPTLYHEIAPGQYLLSEANATWELSCPHPDRMGGTVQEYLDSCIYCVMSLDCGCQLITDRYILDGSFDHCNESEIAATSYVQNVAYLYYLVPEKYFEGEAWELQPRPLKTNLIPLTIMNVESSHLEEQWINLNQAAMEIRLSKTIDYKPGLTNEIQTRAKHFLIGFAAVISFILLVAVLVAVLSVVAKCKVNRWKNHFLQTGGVLSALPLGVQSTGDAEHGLPTSVEWIIISSLALVWLYIFFQIIKWLFHKYREGMVPYKFVYGKGSPLVTVVLELHTSENYAVIPIHQWHVFPETVVIEYEPSQMSALLERTFLMTYLQLEYGNAKVYIDTSETNLALPKRVKIPRYWRSKIVEMFEKQRRTLVMRLSVHSNGVNYSECILPIVAADHIMPFRRAANLMQYSRTGPPSQDSDDDLTHPSPVLVRHHRTSQV